MSALVSGILLLCRVMSPPNAIDVTRERHSDFSLEQLRVCGAKAVTERICPGTIEQGRLTRLALNRFRLDASDYCSSDVSCLSLNFPKKFTETFVLANFLLSEALREKNNKDCRSDGKSKHRQGVPIEKFSLS